MQSAPKSARWWPSGSIEWLGFALISQGLLAVALLVVGGVGQMNIRLTVVFDGRWWTAFVAAMLVLVVTAFRFATLWDQEWSRHSLAEGSLVLGPRPEVSGAFALLFVFAALFIWFAEFEGFPALLHYCTRHEGQLRLTIAEKQSNYRKNSCRPRWIIAEFTGMKDALCPDQQRFDAVAVGEHIRVSGKVSPYGVEVTHMVVPHGFDPQAQRDSAP